MKNKKVTYLLGIVVAIVWGVIIFRIFDAASGSDNDPGTSIAHAQKKEPFNDYAIPKDTTKLLLNYRDPFGIVKEKDTVMAETKLIRHKMTIPVAPKPVFNWNFIQYSGYILNPGSKKLITIVSINGKSEMIGEGETKDQVHLIKNLRDSIKINYAGKTKFISIKHGAL